MTFASQLQAAKGRLSARQVAAAVSPLLSVRTVEKWLADDNEPPSWTHEWILSSVRSDEACRDWPCEVHQRDQIDGNPHMQINRAATPKDALAAYRLHMEATHQHLGAVTLTVRTGKLRTPTCKLRITQRPRTRKGQNKLLSDSREN